MSNTLLGWKRLLMSCVGTASMMGGVLLAGEPYPHTEEWYQMRAGDPPGQRQVEKKGKLWPPFPRPVGREQTFWHKYHHAHYWPHPYVCEDRAYIQNVTHQQAANGWTVATTLHDYHFNPETNALNTAGEAHLYWILTESPMAYRTAYVAQGRSAEQANIRLASVTSAAREMVGGDLPPILLRHDQPLGRPAVEIDRLRQMELQAIPRQRLFTIGTTTGGSGGSGGSSSPLGSGASAGGTSGSPGSSR